jgi:NADPH:quinone reductase-like Zn-dependent oxidoreductase
MATQQMIHAAVLQAIGQIPRYAPFPPPVAGDGEAVVTVAAALKPSDRWMASGLHYAPTRFPQVVGLDGGGRLAKRHGARVIAAGRNQRVLDRLLERGADAAISVDRPREELAAAVAAEGPYHLIVDYLWGAPAEAVFAALARGAAHAGDGPQRIRYVQIGIAAGEVAALPAITLRSAPIELFGSGIGGSAALEEATAAYNDLLQQVAAGEISLDVDPVPLEKVEQAWAQAGSDRRTVFVP